MIIIAMQLEAIPKAFDESNNCAIKIAMIVRLSIQPM